MTRYLQIIDDALQDALSTSHPAVAAHYGMMRYHLGWVDERMEPRLSDGGKRLRPLLCLFVCHAAGGDVRTAVPAAAAIEILHNFSLAHDDIEDNSQTRRGRPTLWVLWGVPQAINVGDALFSLAHRTLGRLWERDVPAERVAEAFRAFSTACVALTEGQYLDISFENRLDVTVDEYLQMVQGKTAALLGLSAQLGALLAGAQPDTVSHFARFGRKMGLAFQIEDDILGIWGDERVTGKSSASDILERKKTLPVAYALASAVGEELRSIYSREELTPEDVPSVLGLLQEVNARWYSRQLAEEAWCETLTALNATGLQDAALAPLRELAALLQGRDR
jgi:geranylgeranyl diphosphate synthase type I